MSTAREDTLRQFVIAGIPVVTIQRVLAGVVVGLFVLSTIGRILKFAVYWDFAYTFVESFWLDAQLGIPRVFATILLGLVALTAWTIGLTHRREGRAWMPWCIVGILFALAGVEKIASWHGRYGSQLGEFIESGTPLVWLTAIVGLVLAAMLAVWLGRAARTLPPGVINRIILATAVLVVASVGLELAGSKVEDVNDTAAIIRYFVCASLEEFLEMVSALVFLNAFLIVLCGLEKKSAAIEPAPRG